MERDNVKKRERLKRSDNVLVELCSRWYCNERKKKGEKVTGTIVWVEEYDPVDVASVYIRCTGFILFFIYFILGRSPAQCVVKTMEVVSVLSYC